MKSTKFWVLVTAGVLVVLLLAVLLPRRAAPGGVICVYQAGVRVRSIDLAQVDGPFSFEVDGPAGGNTILVEPGRVRVSHAGCPDQVCVEQGWIDSGALPIICLPNELVIRIEGGAPAEVDGVAG